LQKAFHDRPFIVGHCDFAKAFRILSVKKERLQLAELAEPKFLPVSLTASPVEIQLPNGGSVKLPVGVGEAVLVKVIEAVGALRPRVSKS
jgi:hypothetical protein